MANKYLDQAGLGHLWEKIKSRYITGLTVKGRKITFTRGDGTTGEIETQDTTYSDATQSSHGLMTADDKTKLDGIAAGANKTTVDNALSSSSTNPVQNKVINTALGNKVDKVSGKGLSTNDYTTDEKNKLSGIASGAEVNVQSDWSVTSTTSDAFIKNKPTIPSKTSQLTNDSNYVSDANYVHTDSNYTAAEKTKLSGIEAGAQKNTVTGVKGNAESSYRTGNINLTAENVGALPKTTYEYNKEVSFGSTGKLLIGKFPCYDSNVTIEINATTSKTYHAVAILATQNINETGGGQKTFDVYGDDPNQVAPNLYLLHPTNSRYIEIYFSPEAWSKNFIHIQALSMQGTPTNICESVSSIPSTANVKPTNQSRYLNTLVYRPTTANDNYHDSKMRYYLATNTMTTGKPPVDAQIIHLPWDNTGWDRQIALGGEGDTNPRIFVRSSNSSGTYGDWVELYSTYKKPTASDVGAAAAGHKHDAGDITSGTLAVARGGTGKTTAQDAANSFINALSEGSSAAQAGDYIVAQYAGGGTSTTTYHRRKLSNIFKALTKSDVTTALGYTPPTSDTNTTYTLTQDSSDGHKLTFKPSSGSATTITIPDNNTVTRVKGNSESSYRTGDVNLTASNIGAAAASHTHPVNQIVTGDSASTGGLDPITPALIGKHASPKSFGLPASAIKIEYSTNGGSSWTDYGASDVSKQNLFNARGDAFRIGKVTTASGNNVNLQLRVTIEPTDRYVSFHGCYIWMSTEGNTVVYDLERSTIGAKDTFTSVFKNQSLQGWSGPNVRYFSYGTFGGGSSQTSNNYKYRLTFRQTAVNTSNLPAVIQDIQFIGTNVWNYPSGGAGNMLLRNHLYSWDEAFNVTFPNQIQAENKLTIHGGTAASNAYGSANPTMEFKNSDSSQNLSLVYTDYDSVQNPSSLTLIGNQGGEYLIAPNFKATGKFYGTATKADSATTATTADKAGNLLSTDNRNDNQPPSWYMSKYSKVGGIVNEFKIPSKIGVNSILTGSFCSLITVVPWSDNSGTRPIQIAMADTGVRAQRVATSDSEWGSWIQLPNADTNTWRGIQNNLTSTSTTDSLSAAQGKALKDSADLLLPYATGLPYANYSTVGDSTHTSETYFKMWIQYMVKNYKTRLTASKVIVAPVAPNSQGTAIGWCYSSEFNSNNLPRHCGFMYIPLNGRPYVFGTNDYTYYYYAVNTDTNTTYSNATTSTAGLMSATDKSIVDKLSTSRSSFTSIGYSNTLSNPDKLKAIKIGKAVVVSSEGLSFKSSLGTNKSVVLSILDNYSGLIPAISRGFFHPTPILRITVSGSNETLKVLGYVYVDVYEDEIYLTFNNTSGESLSSIGAFELWYWAD